MSEVKTKLKCSKCNYSFSARGGNYKKHTAVCDGTYKPFNKQSICKHCNMSFDGMSTSSRANHSRWCDRNQKRNEYSKATNVNKITLMNLARKKTGLTNQFTKARIQGNKVPEHSKKGKHVKGTPHTQETKQLLRQKALASKHRRLKRGIVEYKGVLLDSLWELELAKRLDEISVEWIRPDPIPWKDEAGIVHNYFPDFYLPEYDLYLDPKNKHAIKIQSEKLKILHSTYSNIIILDSLESCRKFNI